MLVVSMFLLFCPGVCKNKSWSVYTHLDVLLPVCHNIYDIDWCGQHISLIQASSTTVQWYTKGDDLDYAEVANIWQLKNPSDSQW